MFGATKKLPRFVAPRKLLFSKAVLAQSVQSIMGATDTFLSKVNGLAPISKSRCLLVAAILLQDVGNSGKVINMESPWLRPSRCFSTLRC
jgi:hypothetical protein